MARRKDRKRVDPLEALAALNRAISATPEHEEARRAVLMKYARLRKSRQGDRPVLCSPPRSELLSGHVPGAFKVIYDTADNARDAARELSALGSPPMTPYPCPRSRRGHVHLKTRKDYRFEKGEKTS